VRQPRSRNEGAARGEDPLAMMSGLWRQSGAGRQSSQVGHTRVKVDFDTPLPPAKEIQSRWPASEGGSRDRLDVTKTAI